MSSVVVHCQACGRAHAFSDHMPFRAECEGCSADLHVCLTCRLYDRYVENECREDQADPVATKDRRNLCEYWKPRAQAGGEDDEAARAKAKLQALFGAGAPNAPNAPPMSAPAADPAAEAKRKLEELFKKK